MIQKKFKHTLLLLEFEALALFSTAFFVKNSNKFDSDKVLRSKGFLLFNFLRFFVRFFRFFVFFNDDCRLLTEDEFNRFTFLLLRRLRRSFRRFGVTAVDVEG